MTKMRIFLNLKKAVLVIFNFLNVEDEIYYDINLSLKYDH